MQKCRRAFTLPEMAIGFGLVVLLTGIVLVVSTQFNRGYTKGEATAVAQQESGLFLAALRNDMINCTAPPSLTAVQWRDAMVTVPGRLRFFVYADDQGAVLPVEWIQDGNLVHRSCQGTDKAYIKSDVASFTWQVETELLPGAAVNNKQIWLDIQFRLQGSAVRGALAASPLEIHTKLFPRRLNRQINQL